MRIGKALALILAGLMLGAALPAASQSQSEGLTLCVEWESKQVRYSKYWDRCPARTTAVDIGSVAPTSKSAEILSGEEVPDSTLGKAGDFYFQTPGASFFGPKSEDGWGQPTKFGQPGPSGASGPTGATGPAGLAGPAGADGEDAFSPEAPINFDQIAKLGVEDSLLLSFELLNNTGGTLDFDDPSAEATFYFVFYTAEGGRCAKQSTSTAFYPETTTYVIEPTGVWASGTKAEYLVRLENITAELGPCPAIGYKTYFDVTGIGPNGLIRPWSNSNTVPVTGFVGQTYNRIMLVPSM
jgi:hypothetical protein